MKFTDVRRFALGLPEVTEQPHHHLSSFRVRGKIFVTVPPDETHLHLFVDDTTREQALAVHDAFVEKLFWGDRVAGLRVRLRDASPVAVKNLMRAAWVNKAPKALLKEAK